MKSFQHSFVGPDLPAVALEALAHVLGEREVSVPVNGDAVVVVEGLEPR